MKTFKCSALTVLLLFDSIKISKLKSFTLPCPPIEATTPEREANITKEYKTYVAKFQLIGQPYTVTKIIFERYHPVLFKAIQTNKKLKVKARLLTIDHYNKHRLWLIMDDEEIRNVLHLERMCSRYWQKQIKQGI